jgi:hypothetical protein
VQLAGTINLLGFTDHCLFAVAAAELCIGTLGVQEQEQPEQQQPQGSLQGLHLRHGGHWGARVMAGAGHSQPAMGEYSLTTIPQAGGNDDLCASGLIQRLTWLALLINAWWPEQVSPAEAYQLCRYDWMREALTALLERLSVVEPVAVAQEELTDQAGGMYMMLQTTTSDGAVALCWWTLAMLLLLWTTDDERS